MEENALNVLNEKEGSPPLAVDSLRSTKKVRIRDSSEVQDSANGIECEDTEMAETRNAGFVSYKNKLMNMDKVVENGGSVGEIVVSDEDHVLGREGRFQQSISLGKTMRYGDLLTKIPALWQPKGSCQLVDIEGDFFCETFDLEEDYTRILTGGPWTVFGAYLTVKPWSIDFDPSITKISKVVASVLIPVLFFRYYHKSTLGAIGKLLGDVIKIDYMTKVKGHGKYSRIAIPINLMHPLILQLKVDGKAYKRLPLICFGFGKYGHTQDHCREGVTGNEQAITKNVVQQMVPAMERVGNVIL